MGLPDADGDGEGEGMMKTYYVELQITISRSVEIKAECAEDAANMAKDGQGEVYEEVEMRNEVVEVTEDEE